MKRLLPVVFAFLLLAAASRGIGETIVLPGCDETIPVPELISIGPYTGSLGPGADAGSFVVIKFLPVAGSDSYRIYREIETQATLDSTGTLSASDTPEWGFVPWGSVEPGSIVGAVIVVMASLDDGAGRYGVAAVADRDGEARQSPVAVAMYAGPATAVVTASWGGVKHLGRSGPR